ncbi:hypothetical protein K8I85_02940 [bacterium]|nr:hypothetical protein [bacterium]
MKRAIPALALALLAVSGIPDASAQTFPVVAGTMEIGAGISAVALPEQTTGSISAQPEVRVGYFLAEGLMLQVTADTRVWPLGTAAPSTYGVAGNLLWFPNLGPRSRNMYLMAGGGGNFVDPPSPTVDSSLDPLLRIGVGVKVPMEEIGLNFLHPYHFTVEFREEMAVGDETDFLSGLSFTLSRIR